MRSARTRLFYLRRAQLYARKFATLQGERLCECHTAPRRTTIRQRPIVFKTSKKKDERQGSRGLSHALVLELYCRHTRLKLWTQFPSSGNDLVAILMNLGVLFLSQTKVWGR